MGRDEARNILAMGIIKAFGVELAEGVDLNTTKNPKLRSIVATADNLVDDLENGGLEFDE